MRDAIDESRSSHLLLFQRQHQMLQTSSSMIKINLNSKDVEELGFAIEIGEIELTECETVNQFAGSKTEGPRKSPL